MHAIFIHIHWTTFYCSVLPVPPPSSTFPSQLNSVTPFRTPTFPKWLKRNSKLGSLILRRSNLKMKIIEITLTFFTLIRLIYTFRTIIFCQTHTIQCRVRSIVRFAFVDPVAIYSSLNWKPWNCVARMEWQSVDWTFPQTHIVRSKKNVPINKIIYV